MRSRVRRSHISQVPTASKPADIPLGCQLAMPVVFPACLDGRGVRDKDSDRNVKIQGVIEFRNIYSHSFFYPIIQSWNKIYHTSH